MFEFDMLEYPSDPPHEGDVFISVVAGEAILLRCRFLGGNIWTWEVCRNWSELRNEAIISIAQDRPPSDGLYPCPQNIQGRAVW